MNLFKFLILYFLDKLSSSGYRNNIILRFIINLFISPIFWHIYKIRNTELVDKHIKKSLLHFIINIKLIKVFLQSVIKYTGRNFQSLIWVKKNFFQEIKINSLFHEKKKIFQWYLVSAFIVWGCSYFYRCKKDFIF